MGTKRSPEVITLSSDEDEESDSNKKSRYCYNKPQTTFASKAQEVHSRVFHTLTYGLHVYKYDRLREIFMNAMDDNTSDTIDTRHIPLDIRQMLCNDHTNNLYWSYEKFMFYAEIQLLSETLKYALPVIRANPPKIGKREGKNLQLFLKIDDVDRLYQNCTLLIVEYNYINCTADDGRVIVGTLNDLEDDIAEVFINCKGKIPVSEDKLYTAYLKPNSIGYEDLHSAVECMKMFKYCNERIFGHPNFEMELDQFRARRDRSLKKHIRDQLNIYQQQAIFSILSMSGEFPFVLFGPPGTGKTTTLVHAIEHIFRHCTKDDPKILVCTPSNAAADNFALSLMKAKVMNNGRIWRLMSPRADTNEVDSRVKELTLYNEDGFLIPDDPKAIKSYSVIISTIGSCSRIRNSVEFTHIFIDEAGQATEPDTWIPMACFGKNEKSKIIIAGDPKQLGPVLIDQVLENPEYNFDQSLLVRLSEMDEYKNDDRLMIQLRHNYRSNEAIVMIASTLFYDDTLIETHPEGHDAFVGSRVLAGLPYPIIFHSVRGDECGTQSFYNLNEISVVEKYVKSILSATDPKIEPKDIGIVSPYREQASLLRKRLKQYNNLTIDTVEKFQGSERRVIIITTTRTRYIGFLKDQRRTNTAITRAKQLLIIVGNEPVLSKDPTWKELIDCFKANKCFREGL